MVGWPPVIATVLLSRMSSVIGVSAATASSSGVTPECRNVLSPMTATTG